MKIFIGSSEIGGIINHISTELKSKNHTVITASSSYLFQKYQYDINAVDYMIDSCSNKYIKNLLLFIKNHFFRLYLVVSDFKKKYFLKQFELYIYIWSPFLRTDIGLLKFLKKNNTKIMTLFLGSEVRNYNLFVDTFNLKHVWSFPESLLFNNNLQKLSKLRAHEKYSDVIFSVPDQALEAKRPYYHIFLPIPLNDLHFNPKARKIPLVIHAPTDPYKKGTDKIINAVKNLKAEGIQFHFILINKLERPRLLKLLSIADILIDEIVLHGPGFLSLEAMASGCLVLTKHYTESPPDFCPPIISIDHTNIEEKLKYYILNFNERLNILYDARKYVETYNNPDKVIQYYFDCLNNKVKPHYNC